MESECCAPLVGVTNTFDSLRAQCNNSGSGSVGLHATWMQGWGQQPPQTTFALPPHQPMIEAPASAGAPTQLPASAGSVQAGAAAYPPQLAPTEYFVNPLQGIADEVPHVSRDTGASAHSGYTYNFVYELNGTTDDTYQSIFVSVEGLPGPSGPPAPQGPPSPAPSAEQPRDAWQDAASNPWARAGDQRPPLRPNMNRRPVDLLNSASSQWSQWSPASHTESGTPAKEPQPPVAAGPGVAAYGIQQAVSFQAPFTQQAMPGPTGAFALHAVC